MISSVLISEAAMASETAAAATERNTYTEDHNMYHTKNFKIKMQIKKHGGEEGLPSWPSAGGAAV